jgi:hypothetical protein
MILALIEQNPFDRIAYSWGSFHAIHQNHCHIHSDCFIDISVQLGRSGAPWFLTNYSGFECRSCQNSVFLFGLTITAGACARGQSASTGPQITCARLSSKDLDATVSPVDAQALFADDLLPTPKWTVNLWEDNPDVAVSKSNSELPSRLIGGVPPVAPCE